MLSVFICEDDKRIRKILYKYIQRYICESKYDMDIPLCVSNPDEIVNYIKRNKTNGLYFFDIELNGYNGVEAAKNIREYDPRGFIAFVTAHSRYLSLTFEYKVEALAYIQKEDEETVLEKVKDCIDNAYSKHVSRSDEGCIIFHTSANRRISCAYDEILFFRTDERGTNRIIMHTRKRSYVLYNSIERILADLPVGLFYKCHKSCAVNIGNITESGKRALLQGECKIIMPDGMDCLVSRRKRKGLIKLLEAL